MNIQVANLASTTAIPVAALPYGAPDPIISLIEAYRAGMTAYNIAAKDDDAVAGEKENALIAATYGPPLDQLRDAPPAILTTAGAVAATRFIRDEIKDFGDTEDLLPLIDRMLRFLESAAGLSLVHPDAELLALADQLQRIHTKREALNDELEKLGDDEWTRLATDRAGLEVRPGERFSSLCHYIEPGRNTFSPCMLETADIRDTSQCDWFSKEQIERRNARLSELKEAAARHQQALADFEQTSGRAALEEQDNKLYDQQEDLKDAIRALPARSITGLAIKARIIQADYPGVFWPGSQDEFEVSGKDIKPLVEDILALQGAGQ